MVDIAPLVVLIVRKTAFAFISFTRTNIFCEINYFHTRTNEIKVNSLMNKSFLIIFPSDTFMVS